MSYTNPWLTLFNEVDELKQVSQNLKTQILNLLDQPFPEEIYLHDKFLTFIFKNKKIRQSIYHMASYDRDLCAKFIGRIDNNIKRLNSFAKSEYDGADYMAKEYLKKIIPLKNALDTIKHNNNMKRNDTCCIL